ncbi:PepSY domain-containing protein [Eisenbergiella sp.]
MKKHVFILPCIFGVSAVLFTACTGQDNKNTVTQEITTTQETLAAGASGSTVSVTEKQNSDTPLPAAGESVPIADNGIRTAGGGTESQTAYISEEDAKKIALEHADLKEEDISYFKMKLDTDHGVTEYEVEFVSGNTEYDYDIDAVTGAIRSFDFETNNGHSTASPASGGNAALPAGSISEADAKKIALEKVPGATESNLRIKTDYDDGIMKYEVKIVYNEMKYEFEIDAATGTILEWESESVYD